MKRRKNLERAVVLGLLLSTSIYGSAWAESIGPIDNNNSNEYTDVIKDTSVEIVDGNSGNIVLDNSEQHTVSITTNEEGSNIILEGNGTAIWEADDIAAGTTVTLNASGDIIIDAKNGIQANAKDREENNKSKISLTSKQNKITASDVGIYSTGGVNVLLVAESNEIISTGDYGIQATESSDGELTLIATNGDNKVTAEKGTAIRANGQKVIKLEAEKGDNVIIGGKYGIENTQTNDFEKTPEKIYTDLDAVNNIIYGANSSIKSDGAGITDITATDSNIIGQYTDETGKITISKKGINATDGTVDISSTNNTGIYGQEEAIYNKEANISIEADKNIIVEAERKNNQSTAIANDKAILNLNAENISVSAEGAMAKAISNNNNGNVTMEADNNIIISAKGTLMGYSIYTEGSANTEITNINGLTYITAEGSSESMGIIAKLGNAQTKTIVNSKLGNIIKAGKYAVRSEGSNDTLIAIKAEEGSNILEALSGETLSSNGGAINLSAAESNFVISDKSSAIFTSSKSASVTLTGKQNYITGVDGIENTKNGRVSLTATGDNNSIFAIKTGVSLINSDSSAQTDTSSVNLITDKNNEIYSNDKAIYTEGSKSVDNAGTVTLDANNNTLVAGKTGVETNVRTSVNLDADKDNNIQVGNVIEFIDETTKAESYFGDGIAIKANDEGVVTLTAGEVNNIYGAVHATGSGNKAVKTPTNVTLKADVNTIHSAATITNAGDIDTTTQKDNKFYGKEFVSSLYAEDGAHIELTGKNFVGTYANNTEPDMLERTVWAYNEGVIDITGATQISTNRYSTSPNSADVAVAAGTATGLTSDKVTGFNGTRAEVNVKYDDFANGSASYISGDILSAYAGLVNIDSDNKNAGISIEGNLLAGNNGILNVDIGKGGILTGRADDYGDAGVVQSNEHQEFYNPAFSSTIYKGGRVDLGMGAGSKWYVTGQSWITTIDTSEAKGDTPEERATIDLVTEYKDKDGGDIAAHALTVYDFKGDADFLMNLSGNRADTDMLYMKHAEGHYRIMLDEDITSTDINQDKEGNEYSGLRFATVGADSKVTFDVGSYDNGGAFNVEYEVGQDEYGGAETAHENEAYNGTELNGGKPGDNMVDNFFGSEGEPVTDESANEGGISTASANGIMLMNEEVETFADEENNANKYNAINHKIIAIKDTELNDTGETILNMSRANYSNAIYMDRLNKRLGEARYINDDPEEDEGMWVRIRHDRIGKDDAYRSQNTMYELGYDKKQDCDNGERRVGFAVDYMHGDTGYTDIAGKGEIDRYGLWLYDTWMGDKGHYVDYVAKWGHLDNDFEVYTMRNGDKVTGDYSNNVFSVSAEYGRKKDIGNDWYFEPQAQLQLARVTGADYTTNQGTKVSVDGINSLIGRAGFRIGKDFGEEKQSTLYFKADVLHEFLGDQDVYVMDKSTDNKWAGISYDNEGTWYDIGIGYAAMMSKSSYAFIDLEQSFGNDNDDTYQINAGVRWTF